MIATEQIPVTITPEASARVEELGARPAFERILEYLRKVVPNLEAIDAELDVWHDSPSEPPHLLYRLWVPDIRQANDLRMTWWDWMLANFPQDINWWFGIEFASAYSAP